MLVVAFGFNADVDFGERPVAKVLPTLGGCSGIRCHITSKMEVIESNQIINAENAASAFKNVT